MPDAFYEVADGGFLATELTRGPWDPGAQHAGPPSALLGREIERVAGGEGFQLGRVTVEILGSVPIGPVRAEAELVRPGRSVQMIEATLQGTDGPLMRARAWRLRRGELDLPAELLHNVAPEGPEHGVEPPFSGSSQSRGYHTAMEWSALDGGFREPGPATVWMRMRHPLVAAEEPTPLQRTLVAADVGNGISAVLDWGRYIFINVDLTVHLERMPVGEWVCVDATTIPQPSGIGTCESVLFDQRGRIGRASQTLLLAER